MIIVVSFYKLLTNDFEMIHLTNKNTRTNQTVNLGIANYEPISRSYFKMIEIFRLVTPGDWWPMPKHNI